MAKVGWLGQGWRWWMVCIRDKAMGVGLISGDVGAFPESDLIQ